MRAGLVTGLRQIELREFPEPTPEPATAVVQIAYCGICGTDLHAYTSGDPYNPAICGHEWAGTVSAVGSGVDNVREGDRVGIGVPTACGQCAECRSGDGAHCARVMVEMTGRGPLAPDHGGFASAISIGASRLYRVSGALSDVQAALLEPATVALHSVRRTPMRLGDSAVVLGAGPIGLLVMQCARAAGAGIVVVVEPDAERAKLARELGAHVVIDPHGESVAEQVAAACGPAGADVVFECAGIPSTIDQSALLVRRGGVVSLVGFVTVPAEISPRNWLAKEVSLVASLGTLHEEFEMTMQLVADGRLQLDALHTDTVGLGRLEDAFQQLIGGGRQVKVLVDPSQD
jgi:(R,R)-butanediol dehydrogenase/meso-butanediol dehydrogenase/diacetyl reductase